jgi:uncharacterized iron-regulated protein
MRWCYFILFAATVSANVWAASPGEPEKQDFWLNLHAGEEVADTVVYDDLATADLIYLGEYHSDRRHHTIQAAILKELSNRKVPLVVGMEQIEARCQDQVDRFNRGELTFDGLAQAIEWKKQWKQYELYREICETAQAAGIPLRGLNAPAAIIRAIGRDGLSALPPSDRQQLPEEIVTDDPSYEKLVQRMLNGHGSMTPEKLASFFAAQVARDETMAANICASYRASDGSPRKVIVICGRGHVSHGLGTPARVLRRIPGLQQRIVHLSMSRGSGRRSSEPSKASEPSGQSKSTEPSEPSKSTEPSGPPRPATAGRPLAEWQSIGGLPADYLCFRPRSPVVSQPPDSE